MSDFLSRTELSATHDDYGGVFWLWCKISGLEQGQQRPTRVKKYLPVGTFALSCGLKSKKNSEISCHVKSGEHPGEMCI